MNTDTPIFLSRGDHASPQDGVCLLELYALEQGLPHSSRGEGVCPVLVEMGRRLNDVLDDEPRQLLLPIRHLLPGTAGDGHDEARAWLAADWLIRTYLPAWLALAPGLRPHAERLRALPPVRDATSARRARSVVAAAGAAAETAAGTAAGDAARDAAGDAAGAAARAAAWAVAVAPAGAAARAPAGTVTWAAVGAAVEAVAGVAHLDGVDLAPTSGELQASAIDLYERMARVGTAAA